jgi:hypothetical protein
VSGDGWPAESATVTLARRCCRGCGRLHRYCRCAPAGGAGRPSLRDLYNAVRDQAAADHAARVAERAAAERVRADRSWFAGRAVTGEQLPLEVD